MRLKTIQISGFKGVSEGNFQVGPVTLLVGPNGSGKSTVVDSVAYVLTGRIPGQVGADIESLMAYARDRRTGFSATVTTNDNIMVKRSVKEKGNDLVYTNVPKSENVRGVKKAETYVYRSFGDVSFFVDAFDPERSMLRLSPERRKQWALDICRGASNWTTEKLIIHVGPPSDDWNPYVDKNPAVAIDMSIARCGETLVAAQKVAREAGVVAEGVAAPPIPPTEEDIALTDVAFRNARAKAIDLAAVLTDAAKVQQEATAAANTATAAGDTHAKQELDITDKRAQDLAVRLSKAANQQEYDDILKSGDAKAALRFPTAFDPKTTPQRVIQLAMNPEQLSQQEHQAADLAQRTANEAEQRARFTVSIAERRTRLSEVVIPTQPAPPSFDGRSVSEELARLTVLLDASKLAVRASDQQLVEAKRVLHAAQSRLSLAESQRREYVAAKECPVCSVPNLNLDDLLQEAVAAWTENEKTLRIVVVRAHEDFLRDDASYHDIHDQIDKTIQVQKDWDLGYPSWETANEQLVAFKERSADAIAQFQRELADLPTVEPEADVSETQRLADEANAVADRLDRKHRDLISQRALVAERLAQLESQTNALARVDQLKNLLQKMRNTRDDMLQDLIAPLRNALQELDDLAPKDASWHLRVGDEVEIGMLSLSENKFITIEAMSAGEHYRAVAALLIARARLKREPWVGLFLDNFEQVYPVEERTDILVALSKLAEAGAVDNVFIAGAMPRPTKDIAGVTIFDRSVP